MGDLSFTLLGPPHVRHADEALLFLTRKELALLLYLAVEGCVHLRQHLSELFWPERDARHGRAALRISLLHLRQLLGEDTGGDPVPHLLITRDTLGLDLTSRLESDLQTLHDAWTVARAATSTIRTMPDDARHSLLGQTPTRDQPRAWCLSGRLLPARCSGLRRLGALPTRTHAPASTGARSPSTLLDGPLLGRTTELSALITLYHAAQGGHTQVVLLEGEAGIGKTRLASEFLAWAAIEGADVLLESLAVGSTIAVRSYRVLVTSRLCATCALARDWKSAYSYAVETVAVRNELASSLLFIDFQRCYETEALLRGGEEERAAEEVQRLEASSRTNRRLRLSSLRAQATLAQWKGETQEALASFQEAEVLAAAMGLPGELWQVQAALGDAYIASGEREHASQAFARARANIERLAEKMGDEALRTRFLAEPAVRRVWQQGRA